MSSASNGQEDAYNDSEDVMAQIKDPNIVLKIANSRQANPANTQPALFKKYVTLPSDYS